MGDLIEVTRIVLEPDPAERKHLWKPKRLKKKLKFSLDRDKEKKQLDCPMGNTMMRRGYILGDNSEFGFALLNLGEKLRQSEHEKYEMEQRLNAQFISEIKKLKVDEIKTIQVIFIRLNETLKFLFFYFFMLRVK